MSIAGSFSLVKSRLYCKSLSKTFEGAALLRKTFFFKRNVFKNKNNFPEKKPLINLTPAAAAQFKKLMRNNNEYTQHIKIFTKKGGCAGNSYYLDYVEKPEKLDKIFEMDGISILVDGKALFKVIGCEIDYVNTPLSSEFVFKNPNAKEVCGCGHSFKI